MLLKSCSSKQVSTLEGPEKFVRRFVEAVRFACKVCKSVCIMSMKRLVQAVRVLVEEDLRVT
jgi:aerobic-type carbon monoxide dehydrogenase small subunit (CoxS/CutS family)